MTTWPDETGDDEFEFYDPADAEVVSEPVDPPAPAAEDDPTVPVPEDDPTVPAPEDELDDAERTRSTADVPEGIAEGAISDPTGSVHLWLDDQQRVTGVRFSNRWRARLRKADRDLGLAEVVTNLLHDCQIRVGQAPGTEAAAVGATTTTERLNEVTLDRLMEQSVALDQRASELRARDDVRPTRLIADPVEGTSQNRLVRVTLDVRAATAAVAIDEEWLARATTAQLGQAVLEAHRDAYERWSPPQVEPGEWDLLNAERHAIVQEIAGLMRNGL